MKRSDKLGGGAKSAANAFSTNRNFTTIERQILEKLLELQGKGMSLFTLAARDELNSETRAIGEQARKRAHG